MALDIHGIVPLLQVFDMPVSVHFYRDVLGFDLVQTSPKLSENASIRVAPLSCNIAQFTSSAFSESFGDVCTKSKPSTSR